MRWIFLLLLLLPAASRAMTLDVRPQGGAFSTIQAAVNVASAKDIIDIQPGTYPERVVIKDKTGLTLSFAPGAIIDASEFENGISMTDSKDIAIIGATVLHARGTGISLADPRLGGTERIRLINVNVIGSGKGTLARKSGIYAGGRQIEVLADPGDPRGRLPFAMVAKEFPGLEELLRAHPDTAKLITKEGTLAAPILANSSEHGLYVFGDEITLKGYLLANNGTSPARRGCGVRLQGHRHTIEGNIMLGNGRGFCIWPNRDTSEVLVKGNILRANRDYSMLIQSAEGEVKDLAFEENLMDSTEAEQAGLFIQWKPRSHESFGNFRFSGNDFGSEGHRPLIKLAHPDKRIPGLTFEGNLMPAETKIDFFGEEQAPRALSR